MCLEDISFSVSQGNLSIVGHSGAGKTTLTKLILAEEKPTSVLSFLNQMI